jgi:hypothetical protein
MPVAPVSAVEALEVAILDDDLKPARVVALAHRYLETGGFEGLETAADQIRTARAAQTDFEVRLAADKRIAIVESDDPYAIPVAFRRAPVVFAVSPKSKQVTITQLYPGLARLEELCRKLGWIYVSSTHIHSLGYVDPSELWRIFEQLVEHLT